MSWQKERYIQPTHDTIPDPYAACHGKKKGTSNYTRAIDSNREAACHGKKKGTSNHQESNLLV